MRRSNEHHIYTGDAVNKTARLVTNQSGCSERVEICSFSQERDQLLKNMLLWSRERSRANCPVKRKKKLTKLLRESSKRLDFLNEELKDNPYHEIRKRYKSYGDCFESMAFQYLDKETYDFLASRARKIWNG